MNLCLMRHLLVITLDVSPLGWAKYNVECMRQCLAQLVFVSNTYTLADIGNRLIFMLVWGKNW